MLGASEWWVREKAMKRKVPHLRLGRGKIMFRESDVVALMESIAVGPEDATAADGSTAAGLHASPSTGETRRSIRDIRDTALRAGLSTRAANRIARSAG